MSRGTRVSITMAPYVHKGVLRAAKRDRVSVSTWMTAAARNALRIQAGLAGVELWEREHGRFTEAEMEEAQQTVLAQLRTPPKVRRSA